MTDEKNNLENVASAIYNNALVELPSMSVSKFNMDGEQVSTYNRKISTLNHYLFSEEERRRSVGRVCRYVGGAEALCGIAALSNNIVENESLGSLALSFVNLTIGVVAFMYGILYNAERDKDSLRETLTNNPAIIDETYSRMESIRYHGKQLESRMKKLKGMCDSALSNVPQVDRHYKRINDILEHNHRILDTASITINNYNHSKDGIEG